MRGLSFPRENTCQAFEKVVFVRTLKFSPDTVCIYYPRVIPSIIPKQSFIAFPFFLSPPWGHVWTGLYLVTLSSVFFLTCCSLGHLLSFFDLLTSEARCDALSPLLLSGPSTYTEHSLTQSSTQGGLMKKNKNKNIMPDIVTTRFYSLKCQSSQSTRNWGKLLSSNWLILL